ncbi:MAG: crossover junction endodeoxyribonuclease RuvC [Sphingobacteriales bacterium]|jgi:crossover junction endodeoxyribonuclease RuvC
MQKPELIIIGIDPGTQIMGYGIIRCQNKQITMVDAGTLNLKKIDDHALKLKSILTFILELIDKHHPDEMALEAPFFGKNVQSMLKLGRAQGVAMAAGLLRDLPIVEYAPRKVKQSVAGNGNASKEQLAAMLQTILGNKNLPKSLDATDGLAVAVCHQLQRNSVASSKGSSWKAFIANNPSRLK